MREIKCRAWDKEQERWLAMFPCVIPTESDGKTFRLEIVPCGEQIELVWYTGLKDKNGKESYHKDIVKRSGMLYVMEWHDNLASWFLKPLHGGWHGITQSDMSLMCEVIGNIWENKELLE